MKKVYFDEQNFEVNFSGKGKHLTKSELEDLVGFGYSPIEEEILEVKDGMCWWLNDSIIDGDFCGYIFIKNN